MRADVECFLEVEKQLAIEAKKRMLAGNNQYTSPTQLFADGVSGEAREQAARMEHTRSDCGCDGTDTPSGWKHCKKRQNWRNLQ